MVVIELVIREEMHDVNLPKKRRDALKTAILTKKIKNFHKSKVGSLQKLPTRACLFHDFLHFKGCSFINHKISLQYDLYSEHFFWLFITFL